MCSYEIVFKENETYETNNEEGEIVIRKYEDDLYDIIENDECITLINKSLNCRTKKVKFLVESPCELYAKFVFNNFQNCKKI